MTAKKRPKRNYSGDEKRQRCRTLRAGEPIPDGEPRRYSSACGYIRLRWTVAPMEQVEAYEHRVLMERHLGRPLASDERVHHINHDRADNRLENLQLLTEAEHFELHAAERRVDGAVIVELYRAGLSTTEVGQIVGLSPGQVSRRLAKAGEPARSGPFNTIEVDAERVRQLHEAGHRQRAIARLVGVSPTRIRRVFAEEGLTSYPTGRPPKNAVAG